MESEKVKEIKKGLECCYELDLRECRKCPYGDIEDCKHDQLMQDVTTYINELESENEILQGTKNRLTFADRIELVNNAVETKLKQFAERLKEKLEEYRLENEYFTEHEPNGNLWQMNSSVFCIEVTQDGGLVDETLKEFIGE